MKQTILRQTSKIS